MRLIDADALMDDCRKYFSTLNPDMDGKECAKISWVIDLLNNVPTIGQEWKMGKWVKVHGFCTPGGDPVWACSECGKGMHVYGIEHGSYGADVSDGQWKACPNCGAMMLEEGETHD